MTWLLLTYSTVSKGILNCYTGITVLTNAVIKGLYRLCMPCLLQGGLALLNVLWRGEGGCCLVEGGKEAVAFVEGGKEAVAHIELFINPV